MPKIAASNTLPIMIRILCLIACLGIGAVSQAQEPPEESASWQEPPHLVLDTEKRVDLNFPAPTPAVEIYAALGEIFELSLVMDPQLKPKAIQLKLDDVTALEALEAVTRAAGHFFSPLGPETAVIADNTAQMRQSYAHQALRSFRLKHASLKQVGTALRSLLGLKHIAFDEDGRRILVRDTLPKLELTQVLVQSLDLPRAEFDVDIEWLLLKPVEDWETGRIPATEIEGAKRRRDAEVLDRATVSIMGGELGRHSLVKTLSGGHGEPDHELRLELSMDLDEDDETESLSLWMKAKTRVTPVGAAHPDEHREIASNFHLEKGFGYWMGRLGELNRRPAPLEIAVLVKARVVRPAPRPELDDRLYWTGSEAQTGNSNRALGAAGDLRPSGRSSSSKVPSPAAPRRRYTPARRSPGIAPAQAPDAPGRPDIPLAYVGTAVIDDVPKAILRTQSGTVQVAASGEKIHGIEIVGVDEASVELRRDED